MKQKAGPAATGGKKAPVGVNIGTVDRIIKKHDSKSSSIIAMLFDVQNEYKYLPREALTHLSKQLCIPEIQLYSIATFYKAFSLTPKGRHSLTICMGTACHVRGAVRVLEEIERNLKITAGQTSKDGEWSLGSCALGPIVVQDETGKYHPRMTAGKIRPLLDEIKSK
jgi:NADH:ubiquinone oxidoreductase subunit E